MAISYMIHRTNLYHTPNADVNIGDMLLVTGRLTGGVTVSNVTDGSRISKIK